MAKQYMTPGVYIEETNAFPGSAVAVPTGVPVFIDNTETVIKEETFLVNMPPRISRMSESPSSGVSDSALWSFNESQTPSEK